MGHRLPELGLQPLTTRATTVAALSLLAAHASGQASVEVTWSAPPGCPSGELVSAEVLRLLGPDARFPPHRIDAIVVEDGALFRLQLTAHSDDAALGERELSAESCAALAEAAALIVALAINPSLVVPEGPSEIAMASVATDATVVAAPLVEDGEELATPTETPETATMPPAQAEPEPPRVVEGAHADVTIWPRHEPTLDVVVFSELGTLPVPVAAVAIGGTLLVRQRGVLLLAAAAALPGTTGVGAHPTAEARLGWAAIRACLGLGWRRRLVEISGAGVAEVGLLGGRAGGVSEPIQAFTPWIAVGLGARLRIWVVRAVALGIDADARVPIWRPEFVVEGLGSAHQASPIVGRVGLNVALHFR